LLSAVGLEFRLQAALISSQARLKAELRTICHSRPAFTFGYFLLTFALMPKCPTCGKPVEWQDNPSRPFCSERCKLIDFSRWANEEYRVPGQNSSPAEGDELPTVDKANGEDDEDSLGR
jgi:endogenous inhibitor of DNA gyrase (YacG/DUF329 family)